MVALVLHHAGVEAFGDLLDRGAVGRRARIADAGMSRHRAPEARHRKAALPAQLQLRPERLDHRIDERKQRLRPVVGAAGDALLGDAEDDDAQRHVDLRRGEPGTADIGERLDHVLDQAVQFGRGRIGDRVGDAAQHRMTHAGDLEDGHVFNMRLGAVPVKRGGRSLHSGARIWYRSNLAAPLRGQIFARGEGALVQVLVRDNNVDQALRALKKKMQREGIFREMKLRRNFEKPSERRAREKAEAVRRYRKLLRKRLEREGY